MKRETVETAIGLGRLGLGSYQVLKLMRIERMLHHLDERACNGEGWGLRGCWDDSDQERYEKRCDALAAKAQELCDGDPRDRTDKTPQLIVYHQGDPRGGALYVIPMEALKGRKIDGCYSSVGVAV